VKPVSKRDPAPNLPLWRSNLLLIVLAAWFVGLAGRALWLQALNNDFLQRKGESRYSRVIEIGASRGMIVDRNNEPLAISTPVESVAASPADIEAEPADLTRLARMLGIGQDDLRAKLADSRREFVYLKRQLPPEQAEQVVQLGIPGVFLQREHRRYYPAGEVMAHIIGFTGVDDKGQEALELAFEDRLAGKPGSRRVIRDRLGRIVEDVESIRVPQNGERLKLSIDARIQYLAYRELKEAVTAHRARAGGIVVLDAQNGEVLAMANLPTYNPNSRGKMDAQRTRNRVVTDLFEPGSTLKPFTAAAALEAGLFESGTVIQTAPGHMTIGKRTIHDAHPHGPLTVAQVIQKSSNVGTAKMGLTMPSEVLWSMFSRAGFGTPPRSGFPGEVSGRLRAHASWKPIEQATMSYGYGVSVSLMQMARAYTIFASDGVLYPVTLLKRDGPPEGTQVVSAKTARAVRQMLEMAAQPGGTAPGAQVAGFTVAGKTGTAHKLEGKGYAANRYVASFVGMAPASRPRVIIAVMIDEPSAGQYYGGAVAAPVFSHVAGGTLRLLSVPPDAPGKTTVLAPEDVPLVREDV
jgi:cell division protein FtsI (penicillin-binding protein 3)